MKIVFAAAIGEANIRTLVPTALAAERSGHQVTFASTERNLERLCHYGLTVVDMAPGRDVAGVHRRLIEERNMPGLSSQDWSERRAAGWAKIADLTLDGMLEVIERHRPDVVIYEPYHVAGLVSSVLSGVPSVLHGTGLPMPTFGGALAVMERGIAGASPTATISICPGGLAGRSHDDNWAMRYTPCSVSSAGIPGPPAQFEKPRVCVVLGAGPLQPRLLRMAGLALAGSEMEVVMETGNCGTGGIPQSVIAVPWLSLARVLPTCAVVVHDGGTSVTFDAMAAAVPQVVIPCAADDVMNGAAVFESGAGVVVPRSEANPTRIREAVFEVILNAKYTIAARRLAAENLARPEAQKIVKKFLKIVDHS
ncbi:glycosyltransferase [Amycolatopsis sp. H20-H5]|uniref:glycosyltransferase n=1 Tax=Amycolatopsis sp. H20-H5 TaxID=3046309 RepID=UPI002DBE4F1E|nr:nucleotide disphospho-sugar-binding domain-containing protein [Amycolatopsis sp. H20-H5]MEC3975537.1 nucleotide disphospho-sugar-binding domain-containing protein [Amycolatopsis sp. H20-H5]